MSGSVNSHMLHSADTGPEDDILIVEWTDDQADALVIKRYDDGWVTVTCQDKARDEAVTICLDQADLDDALSRLGYRRG
jgi:hypothetical protein